MEFRDDLFSLSQEAIREIYAELIPLYDDVKWCDPMNLAFAILSLYEDADQEKKQFIEQLVQKYKTIAHV